jgi:hypothetical protein
VECGKLARSAKTCFLTCQDRLSVQNKQKINPKKPNKKDGSGFLPQKKAFTQKQAKVCFEPNLNK